MKKLTANWGFKLVSLLFAFIVWFLITNINDPLQSKTFRNVAVTIENPDYLEERGQIGIILDESNIISTVTVYAPRSITEQLDKNNIVATADMKQLSASNSTIGINVTTNKYTEKIDNITLSSDVVRYNIEKKATRTLRLLATTSGELEDGYITGDISADQNMIKISGPESSVNNVAKAVVDVDVTGFTKEDKVSTGPEIVLYDSNDEVIDPDSANLEMNIKKVGVTVQILATKKVPIRPKATGQPATGYAVNEIGCDPREVLIAGKDNVLKTVDSIVVDPEELDVTGLKDDLKYIVDLTKFLPAGVVFGDSEFNGKANIVVDIGAITESTVDVSINNISVGEVPEGYEIEIDDDEKETVSLTLEGLESRITALNTDALRGTLNIDKVIKNNNLTELAEGNYSAEVEWDLPNGIKEKTPVSVNISVKKTE
ncbi:MAG: hypothetical protein IKO84_11095 [Butyrivibrio sp.]|nr:hypothetical protein [Butyrivibrio sp.]